MTWDFAVMDRVLVEVEQCELLENSKRNTVAILLIQYQSELNKLTEAWHTAAGPHDPEELRFYEGKVEAAEEILAILNK